MFKSINFKPLIPHLIVIAIFFVVVAVYFSPLFQGKAMKQHDIVQYQGMAKEITDNRQKYNEEPFWSGSMFSGMPSTMISMEYYGNLIKPIHTFFAQVFKYPASLIFVGLIGFYILMLAFDVHFVLAILGAVGFAFASFNFISLEAGHNAKVACMMYMPYVFAGLVYAYRKNLLLGCCIFAFGLALQVVNNHVQITYYLALICLAYIAIELWSAIKNNTIPGFAKTSAALIIAAILALGTHAGYFLSIREYSKYSIRGKAELKPLETNKEAVREDGLDRDYVFNYSNSITEPFTFLVPDYFGGASGINPDKFKNTIRAVRSQGYDPQQVISQFPSYYGEQPYVAGPIYIGSIICFLFLLGMLIVKDKLKWALLGCSLVAILLTYGKNFPLLNYFLFDYFPLYNKFRSVTMAVIIPQFCMSVLAVLAVQEIINTKDKKVVIKQILISAGIMGGLALAIFLLAGSSNYISEQERLAQVPNWLLDAISEDRKSMRSGDAIRSFIFILLAAGALYFYAKGKIKELVLAGALGLLTLTDLWMVDKRYLNDNSFDKHVIENYYTPTDADRYVLFDTDPNYRVLNLSNPFNDARTSYFHKSIGGYSPAKLRRYQDLIERNLSYEIQLLIEGFKKKEFPAGRLTVINMLNTKYFIAGDDTGSVIGNPYALGNAWFVREIIGANSPDEEISMLGSLNPRINCVMDVSRFKTSAISYILDSTASVILKAYKPYELKYESDNANDGFAVFSEVYYPKGWTATIDGKEAEIKQVNYVLRGLEIPAGKHTIIFKMENEAYTLGNNIGLICSILLYTGLIGAVIFSLKKKNL